MDQRQPGHPAITPDIRLLPKPRTSGHPSQKSGNDYPEEDWNGHRKAGHPASAPDIRRPANGRTSGACLRA
jgi:hypothetical protein